MKNFKNMLANLAQADRWLADFNDDNDNCGKAMRMQMCKYQKSAILISS